MIEELPWKSDGVTLFVLLAYAEDFFQGHSRIKEYFGILWRGIIKFRVYKEKRLYMEENAWIVGNQRNEKSIIASTGFIWDRMFLSTLNININFFWNIENEFYEKTILVSEVIWYDRKADI